MNAVESALAARFQGRNIRIVGQPEVAALIAASVEPDAQTPADDTAHDVVEPDAQA